MAWRVQVPLGELLGLDLAAPEAPEAHKKQLFLHAFAVGNKPPIEQFDCLLGAVLGLSQAIRPRWACLEPWSDIGAILDHLGAS